MSEAISHYLWKKTQVQCSWALPLGSRTPSQSKMTNSLAVTLSPMMLSPRRDFIVVCSKTHQTAVVSAVRKQAFSNHSRAWSLVPGGEVCGGRGGKQGGRENRGKEECPLAILQHCWQHLYVQQREPSQKSDYPLAAGMCHRINSGFLSYIHWKEVKSSYTPVIIWDVISLKLSSSQTWPICHPFLHVYPHIQLPPLGLPLLGLLQLLLLLHHVLC